MSRACFSHVSAVFEWCSNCELSSGIRSVVTFEQGTVLELQNEEGMVGGSDTLKERVTRIENFLGTVNGDETENVVTQMEDLSAKMAEIENVFEELKVLLEKKITNVLGDMDGLVKAIGGKLKEVETELSVMELAVSGRTSSHESLMTTKIKVTEPKAYVS
ncbi:unnamed protein product [Prunus armeniaca]